MCGLAGRVHPVSLPPDPLWSCRVDALGDLLGAFDSRTAAFVNRGLVSGWLQRFKVASNGGRAGAVSREALYLRVFMLLALELWMRDQGLTW